jgi:hypothetical protein
MAHEDDDFWSSLTTGAQTRTASSLDAYLSGKSSDPTGMRLLTDKGRFSAALPVPVGAGVRVSFITNIGSVVYYPDPPHPDTQGTVVMVRTAEGDATSQGDHVFVKWDDGRFMAMHREHLRAASKSKTASGFCRTASSLGDLSDFMRVSNDENELVHKATRDLWSFEEKENGEYIISRLFSETGEPLKV